MLGKAKTCTPPYTNACSCCTRVEHHEHMVEGRRHITPAANAMPTQMAKLRITWCTVSRDTASSTQHSEQNSPMPHGVVARHAAHTRVRAHTTPSSETAQRIRRSHQHTTTTASHVPLAVLSLLLTTTESGKSVVCACACTHTAAATLAVLTGSGEVRMGGECHSRESR
jgi:hypothetical protein